MSLFRPLSGHEIIKMEFIGYLYKLPCIWLHWFPISPSGFIELKIRISGFNLQFFLSFFIFSLNLQTNCKCFWWCWWGGRLEKFYFNAKENSRTNYNCVWWWWWWGRLRKFLPNAKVLPELTKVPLSPLHRIHFLTLSHHFSLFTRKEIDQFYFFLFSKDERRETCGCKSVCQLSQLAAKWKKT